MKFLVIEDDAHKARQICDFLHSLFPGCDLRQSGSYQSGLRAMIGEVPDYLILDMTVPTYDDDASRGASRVRPFGGRDVLFEMRRRGLETKVIVVTQFESFGEGRERMTSEELRVDLFYQFETLFRGLVYYSPTESGWKNELTRLLPIGGVRG